MACRFVKGAALNLRRQIVISFFICIVSNKCLTRRHIFIFYSECTMYYLNAPENVIVSMPHTIIYQTRYNFKYLYNQSIAYLETTFNISIRTLQRLCNLVLKSKKIAPNISRFISPTIKTARAQISNNPIQRIVPLKAKRLVGFSSLSSCCVWSARKILPNKLPLHIFSRQNLHDS